MRTHCARIISSAFVAGILLVSACDDPLPTTFGDQPLMPAVTAHSTGTGFLEGFDSNVLGPEWTVVQTWPGGVSRAHGFTQPGNRYSLTDNPGSLRYLLDPMTHFDGFVNGYQTTSGEHSCCTHDAGLELHSDLDGTDWTLDAKATYFLPCTNGRAFDLRVYFGDGGPGTYFVTLQRSRDSGSGPPGGHNFIHLSLRRQTGTSKSSVLFIEAENPLYPGPFANCIVRGDDVTEVWWRVERADGVLSAYWSLNGVDFDLGWIHDLEDALDGLPQTLVLTGLSWFNTGGSYADWDYVSLTPGLLPVEIDVKPGSDPNSINCRSPKGVIPVAILTTEDFDATTVAHTSVTFGSAGATEIHVNRRTGEPFRHEEDVDGDGDTDLLLHFRLGETGIGCGDTEATLSGETLDGRAIQGTDAVRTVP